MRRACWQVAEQQDTSGKESVGTAQRAKQAEEDRLRQEEAADEKNRRAQETLWLLLQEERVAAEKVRQAEEAAKELLAEEEEAVERLRQAEVKAAKKRGKKAAR